MCAIFVTALLNAKDHNKVQLLPRAETEIPRIRAKHKQKEFLARMSEVAAANERSGCIYSGDVLESVAARDEAVIDYDLIEAAIVHVVEAEARGGPYALAGPQCKRPVSELDGPGAILVFLPGTFEISKLQGKLETSEELKRALRGTHANILPLHGSLSPTQQQAVFPHNKSHRKIVLATNIAGWRLLKSVTALPIPC
jgi:HrpA-like RNA helicase